MDGFYNIVSSGGMFFSLIPGLAWEYFQKDEKLLSPQKRSDIESKIKELSQKLEISKPIELIENIGGEIAQAKGVEVFGRAGITINSEIAELMDEPELEFVLAHELSHIKSNDILSYGVFSGLIGVLTNLGISNLFPSSATIIDTLRSSPAALVGLSVSFVALVALSRWREECADKLAITVCSDAARKSAPEFYATLKEVQAESRDDEKDSYFLKMYKKILITENGENRFDILHPSLSTRIGYLSSRNR